MYDLFELPVPPNKFNAVVAAGVALKLPNACPKIF